MNKIYKDYNYYFTLKLKNYLKELIFNLDQKKKKTFDKKRCKHYI